jgi:Protein of unknown function (DUF3565)
MGLPETRTRRPEVERAIVGFECDEVGDWVALLACGHRQHVRHRPPWEERPWVTSAAGRGGRVGAPLECRLCDEEVGGCAGPPDASGEGACLAAQVCPDCGAVAGDGPGHHSGCPRASGVGN